MTNRLIHERLGVLLSSLADAVVMEDPSRKIVLVNQSFSQLFGLPDPDQLIGFDCSEAQEFTASQFEDPEAFAERVEVLLSHQEPTYGDEVRLKDGVVLLRDYIPILVDGEYKGHLWRYVDITDAVKSRQELERRLTQLEQANRSLHDFSRVVSHELKAPLRRILGFSQVLREECRPVCECSCGSHEDDGTIEEALEFIEDGITQMEAVIDTLRKFAHLETRKIDMVPVDLDDLLDDVLEHWGSKATFVRETDLPVVMGDRNLLRQVFTNLISNGIKYNESGDPTIKIRHVPGDPCCRIEVEDNGIGIEDQYVDRLFGMFQRFHPGAEGDGIGLALTRKIVEAHEGRIGVDTEFGLGSTFWFLLAPASED